MEEANSFTWEEVCERWQSQPVDEAQWGEMSKEMLDALEKENEAVDADNTAVEQCKTNENNEEFHNFDEEMARHYDEWFKKAVQYNNWLSLDNTVAEQSKTNENNEEFRHYEAAKIKEYEDWFEAKNTEIENAIENNGTNVYDSNQRDYSVYYDEDLSEIDNIFADLYTPKKNTL
jgi:hypothetical protein